VSLDVSVTGTAGGGTPEQLGTLREMLWRPNVAILHHGDCIGVDSQAHKLAQERPAAAGGKLMTFVHPPENSECRAFCEGYDFIATPAPYLDRDRDIARSCDLLIAVPLSDEEKLRSGTWATARYAYKAGRLVLIIRRDGSVVPFQPKVFTLLPS
jgi:hypothetical protein